MSQGLKTDKLLLCDGSVLRAHSKRLQPSQMLKDGGKKNNIGP